MKPVPTFTLDIWFSAVCQVRCDPQDQSHERLPCSEPMRGARQPLSPKWSVTLPERRRLDAERSQIHVSLAAVMYLIINGVLNRPQPGSLPHAKCLVH